MGARSGWPLVGRTEELAAADEHVGSGGVVLAGAAGVGKTRLAGEVVDRATARGQMVCWASATTAAQAIPFGAFAQLLPASLTAAPSPANLLRAAADGLMREMGADEDVVVVVDDAHLLDDESAALVGLLAATGRAQLVVTVRSGERCADAVVGLWKDGWCARVELQPLSRGEVAELVETVLGAPLDGAGLQRLWTACQGNCLVLHELIAGGLETGGLWQQGGVWRWRGQLMTTRLTELVEARLAGLSAEQRHAVEVVALGEPLGAGVVEELAAPAELRAVERYGLVTETRQRRRRIVGLAHPIYGEVVREALPPAMTQHVCGQLAAAVKGRGARRRGDVLQVATWQLQAGDTRDPDTLGQAAREALTLLDHGLAQRLAEAALDAGAGFDAGQVRAEALVALGEPAEAEAALDRLQALAGTDEEQARATQTRAFVLAIALGQVDGAIDVLGEAEGRITSPALVAELAANRALLLGATGALSSAIATATDVLARSELTPRGRATATAAAAFGFLYRGQVGRAVGVLDACEELTRDFLLAREFGFDLVRALASVFTGRLVDATEAFQAAYQQAIDAGAPPWVVAPWAVCVAIALRLRGRPAEATRWLDEAAGPLEGGDPQGYLCGCVAELAHCHALQGQTDRAETTLARAEAAWSPAMSWSTGVLAEARVWVRAATGQVSAAVEAAVAEADALDGLELWVWEAAVLHQAVRLGAPDRVTPRLAELAGRCDSGLVAAYAAHAAALAAADASQLLEVSQRFESMGAMLYAAEAAAQAAEVCHRAGRRGSALTAAARGRSLTEHCQGATTPALTGLDRPLPLTRREREVAGLAARGLSNREIADQLTVSIRTVHNQLHSTYAKLDIDGRAQLAAILLSPPAATDSSQRS